MTINVLYLHQSFSSIYKAVVFVSSRQCDVFSGEPAG